MEDHVRLRVLFRVMSLRFGWNPCFLGLLELLDSEHVHEDSTVGSLSSAGSAVGNKVGQEAVVRQLRCVYLAFKSIPVLSIIFAFSQTDFGRIVMLKQGRLV